MASIGIDFGNVIIDHLTFGTTREFVINGDYNEIPEVPDAFRCIEKLNREKFKDSVYIIYNATDVAEHKIISWMENKAFFKITGVKQDQVIRSSNGRDKSSICLRYGISYFIDDRLEVLSKLRAAVPNLYLLRGQYQEVETYSEYLNTVFAARSWEHLLTEIIK